MRNKTPLQASLAIIAPLVDITTIWSRDHHCKWGDTDNADWTKGEKQSDWKCWQSEVRASIIDSGSLVSGSSYLGGTWERSGHNPVKSNPEISGYEKQMTKEALEVLLFSTPEEHPAYKQITALISSQLLSN